MIRPFDLRDVSLVAQLEKQATPLNSELMLTHKSRPLQSALASFFSLQNLGMRTYVCRGNDENGEKHGGLAQLHVIESAQRGYVTMLAPALTNGNGTHDIWLHLLEYVGVEAGRMGLHHLIAEAPEDGEEVEVLRQAGFAVYVRQDILQLDPSRITWPEDEGILRESEEVDTWAIQQLYFNTSPRLAHLAEGVPQSQQLGSREGYVYHKEKGDLAAYLEIQRGSRGAWINLLVHPDAEARAMQIIGQGLARLGSTWTKPIFCSVRRYQEWLRRPLEALGFQPFGASVLMVKHLVAHVETNLAQVQSPVLKHAKPTSPSLTHTLHK